MELPPLEFIRVNNNFARLPSPTVALFRQWAPLGATSHKMDSHRWSLPNRLFTLCIKNCKKKIVLLQKDSGENAKGFLLRISRPRQSPAFKKNGFNCGFSGFQNDIL
jgi:hypothetical protein